MSKKKTKPDEADTEVSEVVAEAEEFVAPAVPLPPRPVALGAPGTVVKEPDYDSLESVVKQASEYKGRTLVVLRDSKDIPAAQKLIQDAKSDHNIGVKVNARLQVRALWRCQ